MSNYWQERMAKSQDQVSRKKIKEIEAQLARYYGTAAKKVIAEFEATYDKLMTQQVDGVEPTPADLYKLDKYWQMQGQMRQELRKLGEQQVATFTKQFELLYFDAYYSIALEGAEAFSTIDKGAVQQVINQIWCADGKSWSQRIWGNTEALAEELNEQLVNIVAAGRKSSELKTILQERFNVSYGRADALVRTEVAHIQTQAAQQRYKDYGIAQVEVWVDEDERTCPICAKHEGEKYPINAQMPVPFHPRCRCCMIPVIDDNERKEDVMENNFDERTARYVSPHPEEGSKFIPIRGGYMSSVKPVYLMEDAKGNRKEASWDEMQRMLKAAEKYRLETAKEAPMTAEQQETHDMLKKYFETLEDRTAEGFDGTTEKLVRTVRKCPNCGHIFDKSSSKYGGGDTCPKCGFNNSTHGYALKFERMYVYEDENGNEQVLTAASYSKKENEKRKLLEAEQERRAAEEAAQQALLRQQKKVQAAAKVSGTDKGIDPKHAHSTAPFKKTLADAKTTEGSFEYYSYQCSECGRWFDTTVKDKKTCLVCGSQMDDPHREKKVIHTKECTNCGELFNSENSKQTVCEDCRTTVLASREAARLKKHGYTTQGIISTLTGEETTPYQTKFRSTFDMYWEYIKKHPEQKEELENISYNDMDKHLIVCIDCDEVVYLKNAKNNHQERCPDCQAKHRKKQKAEAERKRREKKKQTK